MAHEIRKTDKFGEVRSNGQRAWHGLGIEIADGLSAVDGFRQIGLDWGTELLPVYADRVTPNGVERIEDPNSRLHVRADNGAVLGMVGAGYSKFDNGDLAKFADTILGQDVAPILETAGSLFDGRRVFALMRMPKSIIARGGDEQRPYMVLSTGHGGFASVSAQLTAIRVVCNNTITMADREVGARRVRLIHAGDMAGKIETAKLLMGFATEQVERLAKQVEALSHRDIDATELRAFMNAAFEAAFPQPDGEEELAKWVEKKNEVFGDWRVRFESAKNAGGFGRTAWTALNTVTEWHDHERGRSGDGTDARVHSNLFGASHLAKAKTMKLALQLAGAV